LIADEKIREIRDRIDIVEVVSSYLELKRSGVNHFGCCPFHHEKTPAFNVNSARQIFHCFGCGVGGNVFSFLMRIEGLSFPDAVKRLGERVGIEVEDEDVSPEEQKRREQRERLYRINEVASNYYHAVLMESPEGETARRYLKQRGYGRDTAQQFLLGFAGGHWEALAEHLVEKGFTPEDIRATGLTRVGNRGDYDLFRNRLIFPIFDLRGRVIAFGGRVLDDGQPKYINSPESAIYAKGSVLYGHYQAKEVMRQQDAAVIVEGYFDQLALHRAGFRNAVATCGTALTRDHGRLLKRYSSKVLLLFDQDSAGRKATFRAMDVLLAESLNVAVVELPGGEDPDSFLKKEGSEAFQIRFDQARPVLDLFMQERLAEAGEDLAERAKAVEEICAKIRLLPSEVERRLYLPLLAQRSGLQEEFLARKILAAASSREAPNLTRRPAPLPQAVPAVAREKAQDGLRKAQEWLLRMMFDEEGGATIRNKVAEEGCANLFLDPQLLVIAEQTVGIGANSGAFTEQAVFDSLDEQQKGILSGILMKEGDFLAEDPSGIFTGCRQAVAKGRLRQRADSLLKEIQVAEREGRQADVAPLFQELTEINRRLKTAANKI